MTGSLVAGCTANGQVKMFSVNSKKEIADMAGHNDDEISRVVFSPCGNRILTASADKTARYDMLNVLKHFFTDSIKDLESRRRRFNSNVRRSY